MNYGDGDVFPLVSNEKYESLESADSQYIFVKMKNNIK